MNYAKIVDSDIVNGEGVRVSLFVSGCRRRCKGCFNAEAQSFEYGQPFDQGAFEKILADLDDGLTCGLSILGGEPFEPENILDVLTLCTLVKTLHPDKTIWIWTGYTIEQLTSMNKYAVDMLLSYVDVLVDGEFIEAERDLDLRFRGSRNQRIIDMNKTFEKGTGEIVLWN